MKFLEEVKKRIKIVDAWYLAILGVFLMAMYLLGQQLENNYREIIICIVIVMGLFVLMAVKLWTRIELYQFAFVFIIVAGVLSLVIQPIFNIPDETAHFARAEYLSRGNIIVDTEETAYETIQSVIDLHGNLRTTYISSSIKGEEIDYSTSQIGHIAAGNASFLYIPQAIGIFIAKILQLDVIWMLWLARLGNLVCYALGIGLALKIAPKMKFVLFFVSTLPMCIQQAASCSPDVVINASAILLIAFFLSLYCSEEKKITWKQVALFIVLAIIVTISKVTNMFVAGLILLIPYEKFGSRKKSILTKCLIIAGVICAGGLQYIHTTLFSTAPELLQYFETTNVNSSEQIKYIITHFQEWFIGFGVTLIYNLETYWKSLNTFGCLEYSNPLITMMMLIMFVKVCVQEPGVRMNKISKSLIFLMVAGIYAVTCLAMYITWSPVGGTEILGVQGRYFIPVLALAPLLLSPSIDSTTTERRYTGDFLAILGMNGAILITTALRYY